MHRKDPLQKVLLLVLLAMVVSPIAYLLFPRFREAAIYSEQLSAAKATVAAIVGALDRNDSRVTAVFSDADTTWRVLPEETAGQLVEYLTNHYDTERFPGHEADRRVLDQFGRPIRIFYRGHEDGSYDVSILASGRDAEWGTRDDMDVFIGDPIPPEEVRMLMERD